MSRLKLWFKPTKYMSHLRMARLYHPIFADHCELVSDANYAQAEIVFLYLEPHDYDSFYRAFPALATKYVIAYCVWEASEIPDSYKRSIQRVQEIWTCSRYCQAAFARHHPCVHYVPHIIARDMTASEDDLHLVKHRIAYDPRLTYFLTIARRWGGHKNVQGLVGAFTRQRHHMPHARLIVKVKAGARPGPYTDPRVIWIAEDCGDAQINALYRLSQVYVSAHRGEGWGLTMSDAMLFGLPVMATGYSGNLEFMNAENSVLFDFVESRIRPEDQYCDYTGDMAWAYPDHDDVAGKFQWMYDALTSDVVASRVRRAADELIRFDQRAVESRILERLHAIRQ